MANTWDTNTYDWTKSAGNVFGNVTNSSPDWGSFGGGTDWNQTPGVDWGGSLDLPGLQGKGALATDSSGFNWNNAFGAIGKALDMAKAWKGQSAGTSTGSGTVSIPTDKESTTTQISPSIRVVRGPMRVKQTTTGGSSGGGIGSTLLGIGSTVASLIPGGQPVGAALGVASKGASMFGV
jgi:hypothetical protein